MKKLIAILLLTALLSACASQNTVEPTTTEPTTTAPTELSEILAGFGNNAVTDRASYAVAEASPTDALMLTAIAQNQAGELIYDNTQVQIAYWTEYQNFLNSYGAYLMYMGLDTSTPLSEQNYEEGKTWEQYFLENAVAGLHRNYALSEYAKANGYTMSDEDIATIEGITAAEGDFVDEYTSNGFADADSYIQNYFGKGTDAKAYQAYNYRYFAAADCYYAKYDELTAAMTDADILAYYDANAEAFAEQGILKLNNINVRHILIQPEGAETTWDEAAWAAAEAQAQALLEQWKLDATEEAFAALAKEHTTDPGSKENGGLYEDVAPGDMVTEFNDWCFDASRQIGDSGIVKTSYGYHIMYFVGQSETRAWYDKAKEELLHEQLEAFMDECLALYPLAFDYSCIYVYDLQSATNAEPQG